MTIAVRFSAASCLGSAGEPLLAPLDVELPVGEALVLAGGGMSGKSAALAMCVGGLTPASGRVEVLGVEPSRLSAGPLNDLRRRIGYVPQRGGLLANLDLRANIALPLRFHLGADARATAAGIERVQALLGIEPLPALLPAEATLLMRQVASIARALVLGPELLLVDEPDSGLDGVAAEEIWRLLWRVQSTTGVTILASAANAAAASPLTARALTLVGRSDMAFRLIPGLA